MTISVQQAEKLLNSNLSFSQLGFSMLLTRLKGLYAKNPSPASLQECTREINTFLAKFHTIMIPDCAIIANL